MKSSYLPLTDFCTTRASEASLIVSDEMRIISGRYRGLQLTVPSGASLRPSSDRLRSGVFSALDSLGVLENAEVLDLFAGTGAYGFEALSRGATHSVLIEQDTHLVAAMQESKRRFSKSRESDDQRQGENQTEDRAESQGEVRGGGDRGDDRGVDGLDEATIVQGSLPGALARAADVARSRAVPAYSLVFADPPYALPAEWLPNLLAEYLLVHADSILVFESGKDAPAFEERDVAELGGMKFELFKERVYGDSIVRFYRWR